MGAIYRREVGAFFTSSIGYVFLAVFYLFSGTIFYFATVLSGTSDMSGLFSVVFISIIFLVPIITMRLFTEEKKQKTDQLLLTSPISLTSMVLGKFFAALTLYTIGISVFFLYGIILSYFGNVSWSLLLSNFLALFLLGASFIAIGTFISALTENQVVAAVAGFFTLLILWMLDTLASLIDVEFISNLFMEISFYSRYTEFTSGLFNLSSVLFYISAAAIFLFLTIRVFEKKRWS